MRAALLALTMNGGPFAQGDANGQGDKCKICRDYNATCVKAHSKEACKSEFNVCLKHCRDLCRRYGSRSGLFR